MRLATYWRYLGRTLVSVTALPEDYPELLELLKREIGSARTRAALAVNHELIGLYWRIGREILVHYNFEFLGLAEHVRESRLERSLIAEIERFMIELGAGFAFVATRPSLATRWRASTVRSGLPATAPNKPRRSKSRMSCTTSSRHSSRSDPVFSASSSGTQSR